MGTLLIVVVLLLINTTALSRMDNTDNYAIESSVNVPSKPGKLVDVNLTIDVTHSYMLEILKLHW